MNVYIYGGKSRDDAKVSLVPGNAQAAVDTLYYVDYSQGILVVAFPDKQEDPAVEMPTHLEFEYWIQAVASTEDGGQSNAIDNSASELAIGETEEAAWYEF